MAELTTDQLRIEIDNAEERGDFAAAMRLKREWFRRIMAERDRVDALTPAARRQWSHGKDMGGNA
jgi:hypothetical protein